MKIAYFDCYSGISGDMVLGALIDLGLEIKYLEGELSKLGIKGYKLKQEKTIRNGITGTKLIVEVRKQKHERSYKDIEKIIVESGLNSDIKNLSLKIFKDLAEVEGIIHNKDYQNVCFHEIGAIDSIIDIVGTVIGLEKLEIKEVFSSKVHIGKGFVKCAHGTLPVPAPATLELLKDVPVYSTEIEKELVTPTGAAILKNIAKGFDVMPEIKISSIGYGAGTEKLEIPNFLRIILGEKFKGEFAEDKVIQIETNIDDMNPEIFSYVTSLLKEKGCLDYYLTPIYMKKNRPATLLTVLTEKQKLNDILKIIFSETTTIGVRINEVGRKKLEREIRSVKTKFGEVEVKISKLNGEIVNISSEYESCKKIAQKNQIPLKDVYKMVEKTIIENRE